MMWKREKGERKSSRCLVKQRAHVRHLRWMRRHPIHCTPKSFRWIRRGAAPNPFARAKFFLAPISGAKNSLSMAPMHFLFFVSNSSADCNFLFLISLLPKLSHPSPTALPTATARSSRAYGAHARCQKWWPSPAPEPAAPRPVGPGYEHAP